MTRQILSAGEEPRVVLQIQGELRLKGHDAPEIVAKSETEEDITLEEREGAIYITSQSDCSVRVPKRASLELEVAGNAHLKALDGPLTVKSAHGELYLRGVGPVHVEVVHGNLVARNLAGDLQIDEVNGNATVRDVQGNCTVTGTIGGNLSLDDVDNDVTAKAGGNIQLRLDPAPGQNYSFEAGGNIYCRLAKDASVMLDVPRAAKIVVNWPELETPAPQVAPASLTIGEGDARLSLSAGGNVVLDSHAVDWDMVGDIDLDIDEINGLSDTINEQIQQQVEAQLRMVETQLEGQMASLSARLGASKLTEEQIQRLEERTREAMERANMRAQERMRRAQERLERKLAEAQRKVEQKTRAAERAGRSGRSFGVNFRVPPIPPIPPVPPIRPRQAASAEPVSEEERLMILRMLEQKKITLEQAEDLLAALEGKEA
ncbi:MAG: hypothetical protein JW726_16685 [Anaerolineales bacterium]|nr:hypothetical protein [Anaerolineales bacterium]